MTAKHRCPRRYDYGMFEVEDTATPDKWVKRDGRKGPRTCTYCGSLHPDDFMAVVSNGSAKLGPTDKTYKVYVEIPSVTHQPTTTTWKNGKKITRKVGLRTPKMLKFYFQHLEEDQRREFVDLINTSALKIGYPGHFYVLPFFAVRGEKEA